MKIIYIIRQFVAAAVVTLCLVGLSFSQQPPVSYSKARKAALFYAEQLWGKVKVGNGVTFVDPIDVPTVYMFLIYCGKNEIPEENTIIKHVSEARVIRLQGEELLKQAKAENDPLLIKNANKTIENAWEKMRDEENFGTVFISAIHPDHPGLALYRGLPLNYVALEDAKKIADQSLGNQSNQLRRYIFVGLFDYCVEFESNGNKVL